MGEGQLSEICDKNALQIGKSQTGIYHS